MRQVDIGNTMPQKGPDRDNKRRGEGRGVARVLYLRRTHFVPLHLHPSGAILPVNDLVGHELLHALHLFVL